MYCPADITRALGGVENGEAKHMLAATVTANMNGTGLTPICLGSPVAFYLANKAAGAPVSEVLPWVGAALMAVGVVLESVADAQKKAAKKINKNRFVDTGVYKLVRCPNYLGELVIWTGAFIVCFGACCTFWQWVIAAIGYIGIVYVMFSGARRLEIRQNKVYGEDPEYQAYIKKTPILLPFVPIYSVEKHKWLQA